MCDSIRFDRALAAGSLGTGSRSSAVGDGARAANERSVDSSERSRERSEGRRARAFGSGNPRAREASERARRAKKEDGDGPRRGRLRGKDVAVDAVEDVVRTPDARGAEEWGDV